jgi:hypothetical protein
VRVVPGDRQVDRGDEVLPGANAIAPGPTRTGMISDDVMEQFPIEASGGFRL